jgi:5-methylcytosine-specific restriction endonuclease McrA
MAEFDTKVKKACWEKQMLFLGRDPRRWRLDIDGKPVMKELEGADGICGFHFDHIVPKSAAKMLPEKEQKKLDEVTNCQVVCSSSFRRKSDPDPIKDMLCDIDLNG